MASADPPGLRHRVTVRVLVVAASILAFLAIFTSWIDRQVLDTNEWVDTSGKLLEDKEISDGVAVYAVDQLYANVNVAKVIKKQLPDPLKQLSDPAAAGVKELAVRGAEQALQTSRVQGLWQNANEVAHTQLVAILKGDNEAIKTQNDEVVLDLRPIVLALADQIGLKQKAQEALKKGEEAGVVKSDVGQLEIADSKQLESARTITRIVQGLAWLFSIGTLVLFGIAAYLAKGRRWVAVLGYGLGLVAAGLAAIALRGAVEGIVVDSLAKTEAATTPTAHAWQISTSLLGSISTTVIVVGILFVIASFLASPAGGAERIRQAVAPSFRDRPAIVWSVFAAIALLVQIIWPPDSLRQLLIMLMLIGLAAAGLEALSRKSRREFPNAKRGEWMLEMRQRARRVSSEAGRRVSSAISELGDDDKHPDDAKLDRLERLGDLKKKGVLTAAEFKAEKQKLLQD